MDISFEEGREKIAKLSEYFRKNYDSFRAPNVKEDHIRKTLIDPFFEALGWDVRNSRMVAPQYREVVTEDSLEIEGQQKAPDYSFRVGTHPKFYVEAKKCGVNLHADPAPAFQLRRYGWSGKTPISILTDFEEFAVYDCTKRPKLGDKAGNSRILYFRFDEYVDKWQEIWDIFSRDAIWSGGFDQYTASKRKRGTSEVDSEFLREIEDWRESLAKNIALRNPRIDNEELNSSVQVTIDRIIFLRMAEDRGLEPYEQLLKISQRQGCYAHFISDLCRRADEKYNSGLFHFHAESDEGDSPDLLTPSLSIDDKVFKPILQSLYFSHGSPYHFGVLPVEILGTVYERFLGKVIRLTPGHLAKVEEKPEVRKAGGVYYTPSYVVDYVVKNSVGRHIDDKSPSAISGGRKGNPFRVLDMACGSGSFLLGAYQYLLDHHLKWYIANGESAKSKVYKDPKTGQIRLSIEERKRILTTHIFGVDIDPQAVEVSKLSLLLKALEGESEATLSLQYELFRSRVLPNLSQNIQCGNSLIGPDFYVFNDESIAGDSHKINPFDWKQSFPDAFSAGGFDCVIGNPPYVLLQNTENDPTQLNYLKSTYKACAYKIDTYHLFLERAISLTKNGGTYGFIVPNTFIRNQHSIDLRRVLLNSSNIHLLRLFDYPVFEGASVDTAVITASRASHPSGENRIDVFRSIDSESTAHIATISQSAWEAHPKKEFVVVGEEESDGLIKKISSAAFPLGEIATAYFGIQTYDRARYVSNKKVSKSYEPVIDGSNVSRYGLSPSSEYVCFTSEAIKSGGKRHVYDADRIVVRQIGAVPIATWVPGGIFTLNTVYNIFLVRPTAIDLKLVLAITNSKLLGWYWSKMFSDQKKTFPKVKKPDLLAIPIPKYEGIDGFKVKQEKICRLVDALIALNQDIAASGAGQKLDALKRKQDALNTELDSMIFALFSLTADEIALIERR